MNESQRSDQTIVKLFQYLLEQLDSVSLMTDSVAQLLAKLQDEEILPARSKSLQQVITHAADALQESSQRQVTLQQTFDQLQQRVTQLTILYNIANQHDEAASTSTLLSTVVDSIWQKIPLRFAVVILGETELGPYTYQAMRGIPEAKQYLMATCPFPLWGVLARALLPQLDAEKPDYLLIEEIERENLPLPEEFPWMPRQGALLILPLRAERKAQGAILLGAENGRTLADPLLRADVLAIAQQTVSALQLTQMQHELNTSSGQLLSLQLFTRSLASAKNYNSLFELLVESICEAMGDVGVTILLNEQIWHREEKGDYAIPPHIRRIIEWAMQAGQPIFYDPDDAEGALERFYYNETGYALVVPILRNEQTQGAVQISAKGTDRRFEEGDMIVLRTIANCAAMISRDIQR